eukprot:m.110033 g.110033  ORF g.110033 m.110033 type:complete len:61 (+) comp15260_c2_seq1:196-378(+)
MVVYVIVSVLALFRATVVVVYLSVFGFFFFVLYAQILSRLMIAFHFVFTCLLCSYFCARK